MSKRTVAQYFCVGVRRNYESVWRLVSKHATLEEAQADVEEKRAYTGVFNYNNAELRVLSRSEAKEEFGPKWEYEPIGQRPLPKKEEKPAVPKVRAKVSRKAKPTREPV